MTMARRLEERLAEVVAIGEGAIDAAAEARLRDALRGKAGIVVGAAATIVGEHAVEALFGELGPAFARLCERPVERDPGCRGKIAIARAVHALDRWDDAVLVPGVRWVQREPVWGGSVDTAAELRGVCGMAYAHAYRSDALDVLAELLADPERIARVAAAQALGDTGQGGAAALVRYKAMIGDDEPAVIGACLGSLLALTRGEALPFVARCLDDADEERADAAALALGESRLDGACAPLRAWCEDRPAARRRVGYLALALLRAEPATAALLDVVREGDEADAIAAARALATFREDPAVAARVREAAAGRRAALDAFEG